MPFGIFLPLLNRKFKKAAVTVLCGCLFSIMIEVLQFLTESGFCQLDDTIQNSLSQWTVISAKLVKQTRGYNSKWRRESKKFLEIHPLCVRCLEKGIATPATVVDLVGKAKYWSFGVFADMFERIGMANILFRPLYFKRIIKTHGREVF